MQTAGISHSSKNNSKFGNCTCWSIMHTVKREANFCNCCGGGTPATGTLRNGKTMVKAKQWRKGELLE